MGDVIDDVVVRPLRPITKDSDTAAEISSRPGGSAANQAAWLGALGAAVRFAGRVGAADHESHSAALQAQGVDARLAADERAPTGTIVVLVDSHGHRDMYTDRGANLNLCRADLGDDLLDGVGLLHVSGYALFDPGAREAVGELMATARDRGIDLSVDPASVAFLREVGAGKFLDWSDGTRLLFPNLAEGRLLTNRSRPDDVAESLVRRYPVVALKLGADGVLVATDDGTRFYRDAKPTSAVDPTGAGDAFCAGFLAAWLAESPLPACAGSGLTAAAHALATIGGRPPDLCQREKTANSTILE